MSVSEIPATIAETTAYRAPSAKSRALYERARQVMPGGNSRHSVALTPYPIYIAGGSGCRVVDVEGDERIDFLNNFTSLIHGHGHPAIASAVAPLIGSCTAATMPTEAEIDLAQLLVDRVPHVDQVRFCNSGSEAVMLAIKAARAFTGRHVIAKFEGCYHGTYDYAQVSEKAKPDNWGAPDAPNSVSEVGTPPSVGRDVIVLPWNDVAAARALLKARGGELAAVLVDPLPAALGYMEPAEGMLEMLREITYAYDAVLIADEVLSFRAGYEGSLAAHGIPADLASMGKIIGGGFPIGAVAGSRDAMSVFDHTRGNLVGHGGTYNANPVSMTAGYAAMELMTPEAYARLDAMRAYLTDSVLRLLRDKGLSGMVTGKGSLFAVKVGDHPATDYRSLIEAAGKSPVDAGKMAHALLGRGIHISSRAIIGCLSTPMTASELDYFVAALDAGLDEIL